MNFSERMLLFYVDTMTFLQKIKSFFIRKEVFMIFVLTVLVLLCFISLPLLVIWVLNTLFSLGIAYTFKTWLAALILVFIVGGFLVVIKEI